MSLFDKPCSLYLACPMTGYDKKDMIKLANYVSDLVAMRGMISWCPILHEKIEGIGVLENDKQSLEWKWPLDKKALSRCFVFVNLRADEKSFGCEDEYGRHRYSEWQPSFRISPKHEKGYVSIANYQSDGIFGDANTCFEYIEQHFGKWHQRVWWKLKLWNRCLPSWIWRQLKRLGQ